jgi:hypothetical protein
MDRVKEDISVNGLASHTPPSPKIRGRSKTKAIWKTMVLKKAITADIVSLFKAVKKDEVKIENPVII